MKVYIAFAFLMVASAWSALAASEEMRKLDWMVGEWKGEATVQTGPGKTERVLQSERVQSKLGGKVLLIEGEGRRRLDDGTAGEIVHDALAIVSWDERKKSYRFSTYLSNRSGADTTLDVPAPNSVVWGIDTPRGRVRYTITRTDEGEWLESGEISREGAAWMKFFEMRLTKVR